MKSLYKTSLTLAIGMASVVSYAQESSKGLEEVVVTAQKREQNLQDTPIAIAAFDKTAIQDQVIRDISDVSATTPNVQIVPSPGGTTGATVAIRGATMINPAITWEPAVGIYVDGVFVAKNVGGLFDVAELERIEILRGPQGTLYGKNTTGGALNLITRKPGEEFSGSVNVGAGNFGYTEFGASIDSGKVGEVASFTVSYNKRDRDGFYDNALDFGTPMITEFNQLDAESVKVSGLFDVTDALEILYSYDFAKRNNTVAFGQPESLVNGQLPTAKRLEAGALDGAGVDESESFGHALTVTYDINDAMTFKSITAYREMSFNDSGDYDGAPITIFHTDRNVDHEQTSQEFQLLGQVGDVNYVAGAYFFTEESDSVNPYTQNFSLPTTGNYDPAATVVVDNFYGVESTSYALFGQADWAVSDILTVTAGLRWTSEEKDAFMDHPDQLDFDPTTGGFAPGPVSASGNESWNNISPMLAISYAIDEDINTYARIARGWKAGGFNGEARTQIEAETAYDEETLTSYELGLKARWFDNSLQTNIAIFFNDIDDLQVSEFNPNTGYSQVNNAGKAETSGFELETLWAVTQDLTAFLNYGYLNTDYKEFTDPVTGNDIADSAEFAYSPESKFALGLEYVTDLSFAQLRARFDYAFTDEQFFYYSQPNSQITAAEDFAVLNARIALTKIDIAGNGTLDAGIWGKNLTDEEYRQNGIPAGQTTGLNYYGDPRTVGADVTYRF
jgi:iron complex outermembrane receptor protein